MYSQDKFLLVAIPKFYSTPNAQRESETIANPLSFIVSIFFSQLKFEQPKFENLFDTIKMDGVWTAKAIKAGNID